MSVCSSCGAEQVTTAYGFACSASGAAEGRCASSSVVDVSAGGPVAPDDGSSQPVNPPAEPATAITAEAETIVTAAYEVYASLTPSLADEGGDERGPIDGSGAPGASE